ncbi:hypothetical protein C0J52_18842 [Blattella germanica]|nr:hypothetical protein C0J52_18842 [Blattella germanica]
MGILGLKIIFNLPFRIYTKDLYTGFSRMNGGVLVRYCEKRTICNRMKPLLTISPTQTVCVMH